MAEEGKGGERKDRQSTFAPLDPSNDMCRFASHEARLIASWAPCLPIGSLSRSIC